MSTLLGAPLDVAQLDGAAFATLYLSPKDYHRFHAPVDIVIQRAWYLPGHLWPVSGPAVRQVNGLFAVNERIVIEATRPGGGPKSGSLRWGRPWWARLFWDSRISPPI